MADTVAFLGLGAMGAPMARNLAAAGFRVQAWNRTPRAFTTLHDAGVEIHHDPAEAVKAARWVCLCVLDATASESVLEQVRPALSNGTIVLDHGTIGVAAAQRLAASLAQVGAHYLDAPVSGGTAGAEAGTLTLMVGGDVGAYRDSAPVLDALGARRWHLGAAGSGQAAKLVNQLLTAVHSAAAVEALHLGRQLDLNLGQLAEVLATSFGAIRMLERSVPVVQAGDFASAFTVDVLTKDLTLVDALGKQTGSALPLGERAL